MALVYDRSFGSSELNEFREFIENIWDWAAVETVGNDKIYWVDSEKTFGLGTRLTYGNPNLEVVKGSSFYHLTEGDNTYNLKVEKTSTTLIISTYGSGSVSSVPANNCNKYMVCAATNTSTGTNEPIVIFLGSKSSSNQVMMLASDVTTPVDMAAQNANANTNAKTTNLIPFYNTASACITTNVYQSLCENISSWYFGDVIIKGRAYRMSGSVFALDE